ncbi:60S ribosomal protein L29-1 [Zea mays]|uniref:60S ribosomal protein L29 n=2 Tax=Zea mays TaxID=4577 RepID=A0A1D6FHR4_MAIZE|nr:60S ribosomal protein L29 [Zea mays]PWZ08473.1 60S ribosomal protein L29-1 [Zea mays]
MAKSKNHTAHNQSYKAHKNGIKKPKRHRQTSTKGMRQSGHWLIPESCSCRLHWLFRIDDIHNVFVHVGPVDQSIILLELHGVYIEVELNLNIKRSPAEMDPKFLRNLRYSRKGNKKSGEAEE